MNHEYFKDRISAYFDRELKPEEERMIAEHLAECPECRQLLAELDKFETLVEKHSGLDNEEYWEQTARKIEQAIEPVAATEITDIKPSAWKGLRWKLAGVAAAAVVLAFISLYQSDITRQLRPDDGVSEQATMPPDTIAKMQAGEPKAEQDNAPAESITTASVQTLTPRPVAIDDEKPDADRDAPGEVAEEVQEAGPQMKKPLQVTSFTKQADEVVAPGANEQASAPTIERRKPASDKSTVTKELTAVPESIAKEIPADESDEEVAAKTSAVGPITNKSGEVFVREASIQPSDSDGFEELDFSALAEDSMTLVSWRDKRDRLWKESGKSTSAVAQRLDLKSNVISQPKDKGKVLPETADPEKMLLACYYNIASLTSDSTEFNASVDSLKSYLGRESAPYKDEARRYLKLLEQDE